MKLNRPLATFDLETTGVEIGKDRIVEFAARTIYPSGEKDRIGPYRFNPLVPITDEAASIHGITNEMVKEYPPFSEMAHDIHHLIIDCDLAGHNIERFDVPMIIEEFLRCGLDFPRPDVRIVDTLQIMMKDTPRHLPDAYKFYVSDEPIENLHSAMKDVIIAEEVLIAQMEKHNLTPETVADFIGRKNTPYRFTREFSINKDGVVILNIGKNTRGKPALDDRGFLKWMLNQEFPLNTTKVVGELLNGTSPDDTSGTTNNEDDLPF